MRPHPCAGTRTGRTDRVDRAHWILGKAIHQTADRRIRSHRAEYLRLGPQHRDVGQAVPTECDRNRHVQHGLPGSCTDRAGRHGAKARESPAANPLATAVCSSIVAPAEEISDSPPASTRTPEPRRDTLHLRSAFPLAEPEPSTSSVSQAGQALPCITRPTQPPQSRKIEASPRRALERPAARPLSPAVRIATPDP